MESKKETPESPEFQGSWQLAHDFTEGWLVHRHSGFDSTLIIHLGIISSSMRSLSKFITLPLAVFLVRFTTVSSNTACKQIPFQQVVPPRKRTRKRKITIFNRRYIF